MKTECLILLIGIKGIDNQSIALAKNLGLKFEKIKIEISPFMKTFPFFGNLFNNLGNNLKLIKKYNFKYLITTGKRLSGVSVALKKIYGKKIINIHLQKPNFYSKFETITLLKYRLILSTPYPSPYPAPTVVIDLQPPI